MKKNIILLLFVILMAGAVSCCQKVNADSVDVFVPSRGQKINPSPIAQRLEGSAQKAYKNKNGSSSSNSYNNSGRNNSYNSYNSGNGYNYDYDNKKNKSNKNSTGKNTNKNNKNQLPKSEWT